MKSFRKELWFEVPQRRKLLNITSEVEAALRESGVREGLCLVNAMHITSSVFINDDESGLHHDFEVWLEKLAPEKPHSQYRHNGGEDNADAHLKRTIMGREVVVAVTAGRLDPGRGSRSFTASSTGCAASARSSKSSANSHSIFERYLRRRQRRRLSNGRPAANSVAVAGSGTVSIKSTPPMPS